MPLLSVIVGIFDTVAPFVLYLLYVMCFCFGRWLGLMICYTGSMSKKMKRTLFVLFVLVLIVGLLVALDTFGKNDVKDIIDSFEDCAAAGYPIQESYPERCAVPGGDSFTKQY